VHTTVETEENLCYDKKHNQCSPVLPY